MTRVGKYEIIERVGQTGHTVIYKAQDTDLGRTVALKVISGGRARDAAFVRRFLQIARIAGGLHHPNIVPVYDSGDADGVPYLAMAFVGTGYTLQDLLAEEGPLTLEQTLIILVQLAAALDYLYLHSQIQGYETALIHRNVRPANVLLEQGRGEVRAVLADLGVAHALKDSAKITQSGPLSVDPTYLAPEQIDSRRWGDVSPLTDVYALGIVAYEMLTGRAPFVGTMATVLHAHVHEPPPSPLDLAPHLTTDLAGVLLRGLAKPPQERYPSAGALAVALRHVAETRTREEQPKTGLASLLTQAQAARAVGDWLTVQHLCVRALQIDRDHPDALKLMTEATDELQRARLYDEAIAHVQAERWDKATRYLVDVLRERLDYQDGEGVRQLLVAAHGLLSQHDDLTRRAYEVLALFDALAEAAEAEEWEKCIVVGNRLLELAPDLDRPQAWLARARAELEAKARPPIQPPDLYRYDAGALPPRAVLADRYVILEQVSRGGTRTIYAAQDQKHQHAIVALKEMSPTAVSPDEWEPALESFKRMVRTLAQLEHPNLGRLTDHFPLWDRYYVVTEFIKGSTLAQMLEDRSEPFPERQVLRWAAQLCDVLSYLHSQNPKIIYRGLKPDNILVERGTDQVKLVSFSIARFFKPGQARDTLTLGAIGYAAPEQYGTAQTDARTDTYALGVTLHQLLTLHDPTRKRFVFPPVRQLNPKASRQVAQAIAKAIQRDPKERFQTALEMKKALS